MFSQGSFFSRIPTLAAQPAAQPAALFSALLPLSTFLHTFRLGSTRRFSMAFSFETQRQLRSQLQSRLQSRQRSHRSCPLPLLQGTPHFGENFRGLVLGCMGTYDSESRRIFSDFSRSTRFSFLCTAPHSNICQFFVFIFAIFSTKFHHFLRILNQFHVFSSRF